MLLWYIGFGWEACSRMRQDLIYQIKVHKAALLAYVVHGNNKAIHLSEDGFVPKFGIMSNRSEI